MTDQDLEQAVASRIDGFAALPDGWHFGDGISAVAGAMQSAHAINSLLADYGARNIEVFPCIDGGILIHGYGNADALEIQCGPDGQICLAHERDGDLVWEQENVSIGDIESYLGGLAWLPTSSSVSSTPEHYSRELGRFTSAAFQPSSSGLGISVFDSQCGIDCSGSECRHIQRFYEGDPGSASIFWRFSADILPAGCEVVATPSASGDKCHRNVTEVSRSQRRRIASGNFQIENLEICDGNTPRPLMAEDLP